MTPGALYLVPAPLDFGCDALTPLADVMPERTLRVAAGLNHWICESAKTTRAYLKRIGEIYPLALPLQSIAMQELPREVHKKGDHQGTFDAKHLLQPILEGHSMGLVSEAGMPAIADPGSSVVRAAHDLGVTVVPLVGPVSLLLALAASGLNGQNFAFVGYIPSTPAERAQRLLQTMLQTLHHNTRLATASGLTLDKAQCHSAVVKDWKQRALGVDNATPTVFAIGR
jgi:16S rRNA (cytidine1402-2'-O)-methyltransferase